MDLILSYKQTLAEAADFQLATVGTDLLVVETNGTCVEHMDVGMCRFVLGISISAG